MKEYYEMTLEDLQSCAYAAQCATEESHSSSLRRKAERDLAEIESVIESGNYNHEGEEIEEEEE